MVTVPTVFNEGDTPTAAQLNQNFAAVAARSLRNSDIATGAAIDRGKLAQRYVPGNIFLNAIDFTSDDDLGTIGSPEDPGMFTGLATSFVEIRRFYFRRPAGTSMWLCTIDFYVQEAVLSPQVRFRLDSVLFDPVTITAGNRYTLGNPTSPFVQPLVPISDGAVFRVEVQGAAGAQIRGLDVSLGTKMELVE